MLRKIYPHFWKPPFQQSISAKSPSRNHWRQRFTTKLQTYRLGDPPALPSRASQCLSTAGSHQIPLPLQFAKSNCWNPMVGFKSDFWVVVDWLNDFCWLQITSWSPALRDRSQSRVQQEVEGLEKKKHGGFLCLFQNMISNGLNNGDCNVCEKNLDY